MRSWLVYSFLVQLLFVTACQPDHDAATHDLTIHTAKSDLHFKVEVARTADEQAKGLMFRRTLRPDHGMLFLLDQTKQVSFWMRNTLIPLDMLFIRANGKIVHIHSMANPEDETLINSSEPVKMVLEILGGEADKQGIAPGDIVTFQQSE